MRHSQLVVSAALRTIGKMGATSALVLGCLGSASVLLCDASASAQDMSFDMKETGQSGGKKKSAPPSEGPPSEALAGGLRLYQGDKYAEAAVQFQRIVEGETQDTEGNKQKAQFFLGKSLFHLKYYQSALAVFDEISQQGQGHLFFDQTLQWLAQLASQLPEPAGIIEKVGRYDLAQIEESKSDSDSKQFYSQLLYLLGRSKYAQGEFDEAIKLFEEVPKDSTFYVQAQMFKGISHVRARQARPAIDAFRRILDAAEGGELKGTDNDRIEDLAWLSLARMYYTAANKVNEETGERDVDGKLLGAAVDAWSRIDTGSEYWLPALFEGSFAFFLADEYSRAMGNIHTIFSPYFENEYWPEALVLKAVIFFYNCQMENAGAMVAKFHERYDPVKAQLDRQLAQFKDNQSF
jgi:TolA-binding protein